MFRKLRKFNITQKVTTIPYHKAQEFCDIVCISFSEAARFNRVLAYISCALNDEQIEPFGKELSELMRSWVFKIEKFEENEFTRRRTGATKRRTFNRSILN